MGILFFSILSLLFLSHGLSLYLRFWELYWLDRNGRVPCLKGLISSPVHICRVWDCCPESLLYWDTLLLFTHTYWEGMLSLSRTFLTYGGHHLILVLTPVMWSLNLLTIHVGSSLYLEWCVFDYGVFLNTFSNLVCILLRTLASVFIREIRQERLMLFLGSYLVLYQ